MVKVNAERSEERDVNRVYDSIASSWANFRTKPLGFVSDFLIGKRDVLDVGCGSARHMTRFGVDSSFEMVRIARERNPIGEYVVADARFLPFKDKVFPDSICIAVLHHLVPGDALLALNELKRVTVNSSLLSVWKRDDLGPINVKWGKVSRFYYIYSVDEFLSLVKKVFKSVKIVPDGGNIVLMVS